MENLINLLHLEDDSADAELVKAKLKETGLKYRINLVQTREAFEAALVDGVIDIILADFRLPLFDGISALRMVQERGLEVPFIFVSGAMGEEAAIAALTEGATDYVLKHNLARLAPAVERALQEARNQRERKQAQAALRRTNDMLRAIIEAAPVAIIDLDLEGRVHSVWNPAAEKMLGWRAQEVIGKPLPTVSQKHQGDFERFQEQVLQGMAIDGVEVRRRRRDGTPIDFCIYASPLHDTEGRISGNIAVLVDITERKLVEEKVKASLREKEVLLKEIHHRVKNNLAVISSLLNLQAKRSSSSDVHDAIQDSQVRVRAMALIHETLYQQEDLSMVSFKAYTRKLIQGLWSVYEDVANQVSVVFNIEEIYLDISRSVCLGLILNELVTNCLKYAFPNRQKGEIRIFARLVDDTWMKLRLKDDGVGLPPGFDTAQSETLGLRIVSLMVDQLQGSLEMYNEEGLVVKMVCRIR